MAIRLAAEDGKDVSGEVLGRAGGQRGDGDAEMVPTKGIIAGELDFLDVRPALEADFAGHGAGAGGIDLATAHGRLAGQEEDDVFGHEVEDGVHVASGGGAEPGVNDVADFLLFFRFVHKGGII